jgi:hypothetical protein
LGVFRTVIDVATVLEVIIGVEDRKGKRERC